MDLQTGDITSDSPDTGTSVNSDYRNEASPLNLIPGTAGIQKDYLLLPYGHETISALRRLTFSIKEPDGSEKDIVVFDEADAGANTLANRTGSRQHTPSTSYIRKTWL